MLDEGLVKVAEVTRLVKVLEGGVLNEVGTVDKVL